MSQEQKQIAETIFAQLGGNKFLAMTGAAVSRDRADLHIRLRGYKTVIVRLNGRDLYDVELVTMNSKTFEMKRKTLVDIHVENLCDAFTSLTGLLTSL